MSNQSDEKRDSVEQSSTQDDVVAWTSGTVMIRRPRPGTVIILAAPGTPVSVGGNDAFMRVVLGPKVGE